jgi:hypothetical protein
MNASTIRSGLAARALARALFWTAALLLVVFSVAVPMWGSDVGKAGSDAGKEGTTPYTPTQGEWLWLVLNTERAVVNSEQEPDNVAVRYLYDRSKPNTIQIELLFLPGVLNVDVQGHASAARQHAIDTAKRHGWDKWLKVEFRETKLTAPPAMEALIR